MGPIFVDYIVGVQRELGWNVIDLMVIDGVGDGVVVECMVDLMVIDGVEMELMECGRSDNNRWSWGWSLDKIWWTRKEWMELIWNVLNPLKMDEIEMECAPDSIE